MRGSYLIVLLLLPACADRQELLGGVFIARDERGTVAHEVGESETECTIEPLARLDALHRDVPATETRPSLRLTMAPYPPTVVSGIYRRGSPSHSFVNH